MAAYPFPEAEPFRIKVVEPLKITTREERERIIREAHYNTFNIRSEDVYIDLLTDSGTAAMSQDQWAGLMLGDEAYAGCRNWFHLEETVRDITGFKYVLPTHQGRPAENILTALYLRPGLAALGNMFFDTTRAHVETKGALPRDLIIDEGLDTTVDHPFKGNIDIDKLEEYIKRETPERIGFIMLTVTCNNNGGQPVSMENIRAVREVADKYGLPFFLDAARYAENAFFIKMREEGYADKSLKEIAREMFSYADGCTMSAKKDALVNIGGFFCTNIDEFAYQAREKLTLWEGFPTYGGMAGRDLEAIAIGLKEAIQEDYLAYRTGQVAYLGELLDQAKVPVFKPFGGHAIYLDAMAFAPHLPQSQFPAQAVTVALYLHAGIRAVEIGGVMFAKLDPKTRQMIYPKLELVRLAIPRRVYTNTHIEYLADSIIELHKNRHLVRGIKMTFDPVILRHFRAKFALID